MSTISVIIPTYNRKEFLLRALRSVFDQIFQPTEVIVVDDNSDFDVENFLRDKFAVKVIRNSQNLGAAESRNIGVNNAKGEFVAFLDSDDYWDPSKLKKQMQVMEDANAGLVYCNQWRVDKAGPASQVDHKLVKTDIWNHLLNGWLAPNTSTLLFRKKAFQGLRGFDGNLSSCMDHDLWMRIALSHVKVEYVSERLSYFTADAENRISFSYSLRIKGVGRFLNKWKEEIIKSRGLSYYIRFRDVYMVKTIYPFFSSYLRQGDVIAAIRIYTKHFFPNPYFYGRMIKGIYEKIMSKLPSRQNFVRS